MNIKFSSYLPVLTDTYQPRRQVMWYYTRVHTLCACVPCQGCILWIICISMNSQAENGCGYTPTCQTLRYQNLVLALQGAGLTLSLCSSDVLLSCCQLLSYRLPCPPWPGSRGEVAQLPWGPLEHARKKCAGHAAGTQRQPRINRNGVKAEKEACGQLLS